ncbi:hypothetical protein LAZ67_8002951 [Cordylochernes scorpioides]|uniref:HTH CENPB-type domain-containing protein n=1 Tax=Cordylochernes scorpioides TaxID=51811 RepID=A0ABY6KRC0_9ARAC|nr:hypothetical protein LAZ67_8002951 [Cordylochernes scorpioides]
MEDAAAEPEIDIHNGGRSGRDRNPSGHQDYQDLALTILEIETIKNSLKKTFQQSVVMKSNREFENRAAIIVALRAGRSPKEIVDFLKLPKTTIYRVKKQFDEADSNKEGIATRKKHSRRSDRVRGEEFVKNVKEKIDGNPGKSMRAIAKEMNVGSMTIVRTIRNGPWRYQQMNADTYINVLETVVKPWMDMVAAGRKYVFQQDSAPAHKAKKTQSWLTLNVPSHRGPDIWPPNSPDCNPLDYYVWGVVERDVNKAPHTTIQSVKKAVHTVMTQMDKVIVAKACASFRTRLETVFHNSDNAIRSRCFWEQEFFVGGKLHQEKQLQGDTLTQTIICEKARAIYGDLLKQTSQTSIDEASEESFKASRGWFENFKKRSGIHSVVRHGEAASSDMKAAEDYIKTFSDLIKAQGYISQQVFNCDETGLFWKKMPNRTYITAEEKMMPGHKPMKDRLTLALCANASGDCKIKPLLVYHSENPRAFKSHKILKEKLQVMWRSNPKAWVTRKFFVEWVNLVFGPPVKKYLQENNLAVQALLILDNYLIINQTSKMTSSRIPHPPKNRASHILRSPAFGSSFKENRIQSSKDGGVSMFIYAGRFWLSLHVSVLGIHVCVVAYHLCPVGCLRPAR